MDCSSFCHIHKITPVQKKHKKIGSGTGIHCLYVSKVSLLALVVQYSP